LLGYALYAADPLAAITTCTDTFYVMGTLKGGDVKIP
jgi:hypothetical protein